MTRAFLTFKATNDGYTVDEWDLISDGGVAEVVDGFYFVPLTITETGAPVGDPGALGIVVTNIADTVWNGITVGVEVVVDNGISGENVLRYLTWQRHQGNLLDFGQLVMPAGDKFQSLRGRVYDGAPMTIEGVRVITTGGTDPHPDFSLFEGNTGTYTPPVTITGTVSGFTSDSRIIVYNVTTGVETHNAIVNDTSWSVNYENGTGYTAGDTIDVFHVYYQADGEYATRKTRTRTVAGAGGWSVLIDEVECDSYSTYFDTFGTTGEAVYATGEFAFDGAQIDVNIDVPGAAVAWFAHKLFQWDKYALWFTGNREFFQKISAGSTTQINIGDMLLDNIADPARNYVQDDVIQVVRDDASYPVRNPSTGGGGIDVVWKQPVLAVTTGGLSPSEGQIKTWVRSELDAAPLDADLKLVNGISVTGSGTELDPWGPV